MRIEDLGPIAGKTLKLVKHEILAREKDAVPGLAWNILWPLLLAGGFLMAFNLARGGSNQTGAETFLSTYLGVLTWTTGSAVLMSNLNVWKPNRVAITDIAFSFTVLSVVDVTVKYIFFLVQLFIGVAIWLILIPHDQWYLVLAYLLVYILALYLALLTMAWVASMVGAVTPDMSSYLPPVLLVLLALSPIFQHNGDALPWIIRLFNELNPLAIWATVLYSTIDVAKSGPTPPVLFLVVSMVAVVIGRLAVRRFYSHMAKVI